MNSQVPQMLTINETAERSGLSKHYLRELCKKSLIVCVRAGVKYLINFEKLIEYLNAGGAKELKKEEELEWDK